MSGMLRKWRRDSWCRQVIEHGRRQQKLMVTRGGIDREFWPEEYDLLTIEINREDRILNQLRDKLRQTA